MSTPASPDDFPQPPPSPAPPPPPVWEWDKQQEQTQATSTAAYAGFWERFFGLVLDGIILAVPIVLAVIVIGLAIPDTADAPTGIIGVGVVFVFALALQAAYFIVGLHKYGCTIGGKVMGIRCVDEQGQWPTWKASTIRYAVPAGLGIAQIVPLLGLLSFPATLLNYLWMLWDPRKQCWMDKAAGTFVVKTRIAPPPDTY